MEDRFLVEWGSCGGFSAMPMRMTCGSRWVVVGAVLSAATGVFASAEVIVDNSDPGFTILSGTWNTGTAATP